MHACWRGNAAYSALAAAVLSKTRRMGAWTRLSSYIAVSRRQRELLIQSGIPEEKSGLFPISSGKNPSPYRTPRAGTFCTPDASPRKRASSSLSVHGSFFPRPDALFT